MARQYLMELNLFLSFVIILATSVQGQITTLNQPPLVTSRATCLSDFECSSKQYCTDFSSTEVPFRCVPRLSVNSTCKNVFGRECADGLYCTFGEILNTPICKRQLPLRSSCRLDAVSPCQAPLICSRDDEKCSPFDTGFDGDSCIFDRHCQQSKGFFCDADAHICRPKFSSGKVCGIRANNFECQGYCASGRNSRGKCVPTQPEGASCLQDRHCTGNLFPEDPLEIIVCNIPLGFIGKCVRRKDIIRSLGAKCNPRKDACDARRGLSCRRAGPKRKFVCQQRVSAKDSEAIAHCTPNNALSVCLPNRGEPTECRREKGADIFYTLFVGFFGCLRRREVIPRGAICSSTSYAICASGLSCEFVPGISPQVKFCVRLKGNGQECNNKFKSICRVGLKCVKGKCQKGNTSTVKATHAGFGADCASLPCVPGTVCRKTNMSEKSCQLPILVVKKGQACFNTALFEKKCAPGLQCATNRDGLGIKSCRENGVGEVCEDNSSCKDGLKCSSYEVEPPNVRHCYDPKLNLDLGEKCDPDAKPSEKRCVATQKVSGFGPEIRCLSKGTGFVCQRPKKLFEFCNLSMNVGCLAGSMCSKLGVCMPTP